MTAKVSTTKTTVSPADVAARIAMFKVIRDREIANAPSSAVVTILHTANDLAASAGK